MSKFEIALKPKPEETSNNATTEESKLEDSAIDTPNENEAPSCTSDSKGKPESSKETKIMTKWSTDKIVALGLVIMGVLSISGYIAYALYTGNSNGTEIPMAIVSGLTGFLGRGALPHEEYPNKYGYPPQGTENGGSNHGRNGTSQHC